MTITDVPCKCCGVLSPFIGAVDFHKSCVDRSGQKPFPFSGQEVYYHGCPNCSFVFSPTMDDWSDEEFIAKIYNADYIKADPPIPGRVNVPIKETPAYRKGKYIASFFPGAQEEIRVLDFGSGGNPGPTGLALQEEGFDLRSYDPFRADTPPIGEEQFDLIIAIEVLERVADLQNLGHFMKNHLAPGGVIWIETLLHSDPISLCVLNSWYIAPRNGHISIFSQRALTLLFESFGIKIMGTPAGWFGFRDVPRFLNKIFPPSLEVSTPITCARGE